MNRRLEIDIKSIQDQHEEQQLNYLNSEVEEEENQEINEQTDENENYFQEDENQRNNSKFQQSSKQNIYNSVQTFGNNNIDFFQQLGKPKVSHHKQEDMSISHLNQTPIYKNNPLGNSRKHELSQSNVDDEIARIIRKVSKNTRHHRHPQQIQNVKKIDHINKQLLKENTELINQINLLQGKLNQIVSKMSNKKKSKGLQDSSLIKTIKNYRDKLDKAMNINSKLSVRLISERSKSQVISNTMRSMVKREETNSVMITSTIKSHIKRDSEELQRLKIKNQSRSNQNIYCEKCCKEIGNNRKINSKQLIFSPVLQVKNYEITQQRSLKQFELHKPLFHDAQCQINLDEQTKKIQQLKNLKKEQQILQKLIQSNNKKIHQFEEIFYKLVDNY